MNSAAQSPGGIALSGFLVSSLAALLLSRASSRTSMGMDRSSGVQKFHVRPTSRLGGVAIVLGVTLSSLVQFVPYLYSRIRCCDDGLAEYFAPYREHELLQDFAARLPPAAARPPSAGDSDSAPSHHGI